LDVRVSRLLLHDFRGWRHLDLRPTSHVLLAGVPRAGRSDIVAALVRVLDPDSIRVQPAIGDIRQQVGDEGAGGADDAEVGPLDDDPEPNESDSESAIDLRSRVSNRSCRADFAEVEVTLIDLDPELEQLCDGCLEPQDQEGQASDEIDADPGAALCVRIAYRVSYDALTDSLDQSVYFPVRSNPAAAQYQRVPVAVRRVLPVVVINTARPLQLRAEGTLRRLLMDRDPEGTADALGRLRDAVNDATIGLSGEPSIIRVVDAVLSSGGASRRLSDEVVDAARVRFQAEDGSLAALLRAVQPALELDDAGLLPLTNHGSTAAAILSAAEALLVAQVPGAIVLADDFGDQLDGATAEHLAAMLRADAGQLWMSSRRNEVARAFEPYELVRLTRHGGIRAVHTLERVSDRKELATLRLLHSQLLPALTAPTVAITEGPHDLTVYTLADRRRTPTSLPLSAYGVRIVSADNGSGGGTGQVPRVARLARQLGFRVIGLIDGASKWDGAALLAIEEECDVLIRLPPGVAIEGAIVAGVDETLLRAAATTLAEWGIPDPAAGVEDGAVAEALVRPLHSQGLHQPLLEALIPDVGIPPVIAAALDALGLAANPSNGTPASVVLALRPDATESATAAK
jgi:putative ATP-dependent endonuclease of OLD family